MTELLKLVVDLFSLIWPFRIVHQWEQGVLYVFGRYWGTVGPGLKMLVPWFMDVHNISMVPDILGTTLQTVTLRDGRTLTYSAMITLQVEDPNLAYNKVGKWTETAVELVSGLLAELLATVDPDKFAPEYGRRRKLLEGLAEEADKATQTYGVRVRAIRFNNFAIGLRAYRLLVDRSTFSEANIGVL